MNRDQIVELLAMRMVGFPFADCSKHDRFRITSTADAIMALDGWQTIDSAPRDGTRVLGWERPRSPDDDGRFTMQWDATPGRERWLIVCNPFWVFEPTHWKPLDQPPGGAG